MNMYSADPGAIPGDFHLVHLGHFGMGGAGLVFRRNNEQFQIRTLSRRDVPGSTPTNKSRPGNRYNFIHHKVTLNSCLQLRSFRPAKVRPVSAGKGWVIPCRTATGNSSPPRRWRFTSSCAWREDARATGHETGFAIIMHAPRQMQTKRTFDMVELHCGHGYLLSGFISPLTMDAATIRREPRKPYALPVGGFRHRAGTLAEAQATVRTHSRQPTGTRMGSRPRTA